MELQLFKWSGWDKDDLHSYVFFGCELIKAIKDLPVGTKFDQANVDFESGKLTLTNFDGGKDEGKVIEQYQFNLKLEVE